MTCSGIQLEIVCEVRDSFILFRFRHYILPFPYFIYKFEVVLMVK